VFAISFWKQRVINPITKYKITPKMKNIVKKNPQLKMLFCELSLVLFADPGQAPGA
jgi:hypothetical protein